MALPAMEQRMQSDYNYRRIGNRERPVFGVSQRGKPILLIGRFRYNLHTGSMGSKVFWTCYKWGSSCKCRASVTTIANCIVKSKNEHNH
ncbi:unnamed protein product [Chilo suppressalis]|uniref:FLYWCH-type domain-containing protein n=1 Tax=Chilo suppressalis TaxID=168631 RepID=A0ABN8B114_CHISP|nr:hypothetical protein evm_005176 [Chilo suppressalis]CAH0399069.1 unnamed protein product [Chilo suppressalis]